MEFTNTVVNVFSGSSSKYLALSSIPIDGYMIISIDKHILGGIYVYSVEFIEIIC
ncbi:MAG: hypothetical protein QXY23_05145 [Ignisphaera sp.]